MNDMDRRRVLGMVARLEVFRDRFGDAFCWRGGESVPLTPDETSILRDLEFEGLVALSGELRGDRYWDVTDKALEG